ncbi:hypothetical protein DASC09_028880 [Saccharomycopsis crataegensis]|uniref:Endonuclease LCL3 n=1 Tax=Saccharomycopsis crataegensis TaxID=43959 RepID=A0AAV5QN32_9ASCO|nr:hypothetical protein DASC09_028880 [Saccharomycopsis crataegensis]
MGSIYYSARVKSVLSADTIILVPVNSGNSNVAPVERQLSLAYVQAPKMSLNETYSFEARELLRKLLVGKTIKFKVLYTLPGLGESKREFGDIKTPIFDSLIEYLLNKGAVKVKETNDPFDEDYYFTLQDLENKAKNDNLGSWGHQNKPAVANELIYDEIEGSKTKPISAIVEKVISGDRLLIRFLISKQKHVVAPVLIAGIRSPRSSSANSDESEPFGNEAKYFVEKRLLLQDVKVSVLGESANGVLIGKIIHPVGNIAEKVLENGLAEVVDWQSSIVGAREMSLLRASERLSKVSQKGIWKSHNVAKKQTSAKQTLYSIGSIHDVTVSKIVSADTIVVRTKDGDQEYTCQLSSLRAPKNSDPAQAPFVPFAKEFARKKLIGKHVKLTVDGVREKSEQYDERPLVSITLSDGGDLSEQIVKAGWASVIRHRRGDDNRSQNWDILVELEKTAAEKKIGMNGKLPPAEKIVDASENAGRAKTYLATFANRSKINAVVDYVSAPHRLRLILPKEGVKLVLVLGGLTNKASKDTGLSKAALDYVTKKTLQRDVVIDIYNVDKIGGFIGNLYLPGQKAPLQYNLLSQGFYEIHDYSIDQTKFADQLWDAQEEAQKQKLGIWHNWTGEVEESVDTLAKSIAETKITKKYYDIEVNDISNEGLLSFQIINSESEQLVLFMKKFHEFHMNQPIKSNDKSKLGSVSSYPRLLDHIPKKGDLVSVAYSRNGKYYRGRILNFDKLTKKYKVMHIDFGNFDHVSSGAFRQLPSQFSLDKLPPQGHVGSLSLIKLPPSKPTNYLDDAIDFLDELIMNKKIIALANKASPEPGVEMSFTLYDPEKATKNANYSVNRELVENGWAIVNKKLIPWETSLKKEHDSLLELELLAKSKRLGCWEFGDIEEDL